MLRLLHLWVGDGFYCGCRVGASQIIYGLSQQTNMSGTPLSTQCVTHRVPIPNEKCLGWPVRSAALSHCRVEDVNHSHTKAGARSRFVPVHQSLLNHANATIRSLFHFFAPRTDADWYHQHRDGSGVINVAPFTTSPLLHHCSTSEATLTRANSSKLCVWFGHLGLQSALMKPGILNAVFNHESIQEIAEKKTNMLKENICNLTLLWEKPACCLKACYGGFYGTLHLYIMVLLFI